MRVTCDDGGMPDRDELPDALLGVPSADDEPDEELEEGVESEE